MLPSWVEIAQPDPERAATFYGGLFGWQVSGDAGWTRGPAVAPPSSAGPARIAVLRDPQGSVFSVTHASG